MWTLLVPKVATGHCFLVGVNKSYVIATSETAHGLYCVVKTSFEKILFHNADSHLHFRFKQI